MNPQLREACNGKSASQGGLNVNELKNALIKLMPEREAEIRKAKRADLEKLCKEIGTTTKAIKQPLVAGNQRFLTKKVLFKKLVKKVPLTKKVVKKVIKKVPVKPAIIRSPTKVEVEKEYKLTPISKKTLWKSHKFCDWMSKLPAYIKKSCKPVWWVQPKDPTPRQLYYLSSFYDENVDTDTPPEEICDIINNYQYGVSSQWLIDQKKYVKSLYEGSGGVFNMPLKVQVLETYTYKGDRIINEYMRNGIKNLRYELPTDIITSLILSMVALYGRDKLDNLRKTAMEDFLLRRKPSPNIEEMFRGVETISTTLNNVILGAPPLDKDIIGYRGVKDIDYLSENTWNEVKGIISVSLNPEIPMQGFIEDGDTLLIILIPKGFPCLIITDVSEYKGEVEILLPNNTMMYLDECIEYVDVSAYGIGKNLPHQSCSRKNINICNAWVKI